ncbi:MAG TPA: maleylpyruvate isomerase N-terminal domain-containing protein [Sediminibacterium sp.]|nr:maleylpyruvate isomerase N-terminal domain-containing protein [Sediminibacterium sp.]
MTSRIPLEPIALTHLFRELDFLCMNCLQALTRDDWNRPTVAKEWTIKDVTAHLLDGNIRSVSMLGDHYYGVTAPSDPAYREMVRFLDDLNASWVKAFKRVSPDMLIHLHRVTGPLYCDLMERMDPEAPAAFQVEWAGTGPQKNWLHIAREYTEKWIHQQQIRHAMGDSTLYQRQWYYPCLHTLVRGIPHACRNLSANSQECLQITISGEGGGDWYMVYDTSGWMLVSDFIGDPDARIIIPGQLAWQLFSKTQRPEDHLSEIAIQGKKLLAMTALQTISVMA